MTDLSALPIVDARQLDVQRRAALRPGELVRDETGQQRRLPCFFYEVASWQVARDVELAPNFGLREFMDIDVHEPPIVRTYPRYVPCAVSLLASTLSLLRQHVKQPIWVAANGGYRSPSHGRSRRASTHCWGTAANIYRVGDDWLDTQAAIDRVAVTAVRAAPALWTRPFGGEAGFNDDHLHVDLGFATFVPRHAPGE
jgi:hypothetical protein